MVMMVVVLGFGVSGAHAGWLETFDSYADGPLPDTDWEREFTDAPQQGVYPGGWFGGAGTGIITWNAPAQYRVADAGDNVLTARLRDGGDIYDIAQVAFCPNNLDIAPDPGAPDPNYYPMDLHINSVVISLENTSLRLFTYDANEAKTTIATVTGLTSGEWYDVRLSVNGLNVLGQYRVSAPGDTGDWTIVGTSTADPNFDPNHVSVYGNRNDAVSIDDVATASQGPQTCDEAILLGYSLLDMDLNGDCRVNLKDFAMIAADWLRCVKPEDPACEKPWL